MNTHTDSRSFPSEAPKPAFNLYLLGCTLVAALGGLLFGFDTAVISGTVDALRAKFALSDGLLGFTVASALIGTILGSIGAGKPADVMGRRGALAALGVIYVVSSLGLRLLVGLVVLSGIQVHGRAGSGRRIRRVTALHRGNIACVLPGADGGHYAV